MRNHFIIMEPPKKFLRIFISRSLGLSYILEKLGVCNQKINEIVEWDFKCVYKRRVPSKMLHLKKSQKYIGIWGFKNISLTSNKLHLFVKFGALWNSNCTKLHHHVAEKKYTHHVRKCSYLRKSFVILYYYKKTLIIQLIHSCSA